MAEIISRFSKTKDLESPQSVQDILEQQTRGDSLRPYSYGEWVKRNIGIIPGKERTQYNQYLTDWYTEREINQAAVAALLKKDYIALVQQLTVLFSDEAKQLQLDNINFDDTFEVSQAIPFYSQKLKEIAISLINIREGVQKAKLKYNLVGANNALESIFYEYLLSAFTKRPFPTTEQLTTVIDTTALNAISELSAVTNGNFQITIEELYDSSNYFDRDPTLNVSVYFDLSGSSVVDYLTANGVATHEFEWLYNTGVSQLCADNPLLWVVDDVLSQYQDGVPLSALETYDSVLLNDYNKIALTQKYIGERQYIISGGYFIPWEHELELLLTPGNNWFYWLSGEHPGQNDTTQTIDSISITASNLIGSGATPGTDYTNSDVIFTVRDESLSGAWLQSTDKKTLTFEMSAILRNGKYIFSYPFPGFGIIGEDIEWTGRGFDNVDLTYNFLETETKQEIQQLYWNTSTPSVCTLTPLSIYNAALPEAGAQAGKTYGESDQITIRLIPSDGINDGVYRGAYEHAWLYKMDKTDLFIQTGDNKLHWPFERYEDDTTVVAQSAQCTEVRLSAVDSTEFLGAVAGTTPFHADKLYKTTAKRNGLTTNAAWLSGRQVYPIVTSSSLLSGASQPGISFVLNAGKTGTFVWEDSTTAADNVIQGFTHQKDCEYLKQTQFSLYKERPAQQKNYINYNQWTQCDCKAVHYSPLGHPGDTFDDYNKIADFMVAITEPLSSFSLESWRDSINVGYQTSNEFGWYKLNSSPEPDIGWGPGNWVTYSGLTFNLTTNKMYLYYRSDLQRGSEVDAPFFVLRYEFTDNANQWIKLVYDPREEEWVSAETPSDIIINPGDYLIYSHENNLTHSFSAEKVRVTLVPIDQLPDFATIQSQGGSIIAGVPTSNITVSAYWVSTNNTTVSSILSSVSSTQLFNVEYFNEPANFTINVNLSGWNYTTHQFDSSVKGARPFWAKGHDGSSIQNRFKGIDIWGGNTIVQDDGYTFVSQPDFATFDLVEDTYLEYTKVSSGSFTWTEPLLWIVDSNTVRWNNLVIDTTSISNLSSVLKNDMFQLVVSGSYEPSEIVFTVVEDIPLLVNYYARGQGFTWNQTLLNTSLGIPPTGGVWVSVISGDLVSPATPYAYLTNRHFPTYASAPFIGNLFKQQDVGGYFLPKMLGVSTFLSRGRTVELQPIGTIPLLQEDKGTTITFQDPNSYTTDYGLTKIDQQVPVLTLHIDSSWMKHGIAEYSRHGFVKNARRHQEFVPYQTKYESTNFNEYGLRRQGDGYDPWFGKEDKTWENETDFTPNFKKQVNIKEWYNQFRTTEKEIFKWKTDIFGNQFALVKELTNKSIYNKRKTLGEVWTRDARNIVEPASASMSRVYDKFTNNSIQLLSTNIYDIDVFYDVMMFWTPEVLAFAKLDFNFDTNTIFAVADNIHTLWLCGDWFVGTWFFEAEKLVTVCTLGSGNADALYFYPKFRKLDLETNKFTKVFDATGNVACTDLTGIALTSIEDPVFTYNGQTKSYNIAFIGNASAYEGMYFVSIDVQQVGDTFDIASVKATIPIA